MSSACGRTIVSNITVRYNIYHRGAEDYKNRHSFIAQPLNNPRLRSQYSHCCNFRASIPYKSGIVCWIAIVLTRVGCAHSIFRSTVRFRSRRVVYMTRSHFLARKCAANALRSHQLRSLISSDVQANLFNRNDAQPSGVPGRSEPRCVFLQQLSASVPLEPFSLAIQLLGPRPMRHLRDLCACADLYDDIGVFLVIVIFPPSISSLVQHTT